MLTLLMVLEEEEEEKERRMICVILSKLTGKERDEKPTSKEIAAERKRKTQTQSRIRVKTAGIRTRDISIRREALIPYTTTTALLSL